MTDLPFSAFPTEDAGAPTTDRFAYQHCCAAARLLSAIAIGVDLHLVCEWYEDFLVVQNHDVEAVSVKHREDNQPAWSVASLVSAGGFDHLFQTFVSGNGAVRCAFESNRGHVADLWSDSADRRTAARTDLRTRLQTTEQLTDAFLLGLSMPAATTPSRVDIHDAYATRYAATALDAMGLHGVSPTAALHATCALVADASRERMSPESWTKLVSAASASRSGVIAALRLEARRVSTDDVRATLAGIVADDVPQLDELPDYAPEESTLTKKLNRGKLGPTVTDAAQRQRRWWYSHSAAARDLPDREAELRAVASWVEVQAGLAESATETVGEPYGRAMYRDLVERLSDSTQTPSGTRAVDQSLVLRLGAAFQLTDDCRVWWSERFDPDEAA